MNNASLPIRLRALFVAAAFDEPAVVLAEAAEAEQHTEEVLTRAVQTIGHQPGIEIET